MFEGFNTRTILIKAAWLEPEAKLQLVKSIINFNRGKCCRKRFKKARSDCIVK